MSIPLRFITLNRIGRVGHSVTATFTCTPPLAAFSGETFDVVQPN